MKYVVKGYSDLELTPGGVGGGVLLVIGIGLAAVSVWMAVTPPYESPSPFSMPVAITAGVCIVAGYFLFSIGRSYRHNITMEPMDTQPEDE